MFTLVPSADSIQLAGKKGFISSVVYESGGKLLIVGKNAELLKILDAIPEDLEPLVVLKEPCVTTLRQRLQEVGIKWMEDAMEISIEGYLGNFRVALKDHGGMVRDRLYVDLVLDLLESPILPHSVPPIGYFSRVPCGDEGRKKIVKLAEWVGEFEKPKFFSFDSRLCAHQRSGIAGCSACITSCGARAIASVSGKIEINPFLCQGCGDCADVCPSGAIRYNYPPPEFTLNRLREEINRFQAIAEHPCVIVFHDEKTEACCSEVLARLHGADILAFELESAGAGGMDVWLSALAFGASGVVILIDEALNPESSTSLEMQIRYCNEILAGAGLFPCVRLAGSIDEIGTLIDVLPRKSRQAAAAFTGLRDKRTVIRLALDFLTGDLETLPEFAALSDGGPFGEIVVDPDRCTLCMACVSVCPESALMDGLDEPKLSFIEANCVQCGICRNACPEGAIGLSPRYLFDSLNARKGRPLHQDTPFCCTECGKAFASKKALETIAEKLQSHPMFQGDNLRRLTMCEKCRVKSFFAMPDSGRL